MNVSSDRLWKNELPTRVAAAMFALTINALFYLILIGNTAPSKKLVVAQDAANLNITFISLIIKPVVKASEVTPKFSLPIRPPSEFNHRKSVTILAQGSKVELSVDVQSKNPSTTEPASVQPIDDTSIIALARLGVGKIDRDLRSAEHHLPETFAIPKMQKFAKAVENAFIDRSTFERRAKFETVDGIIYYSFTQHGKTTCTMTGQGKPERIDCPPDVAGWETY